MRPIVVLILFLTGLQSTAQSLDFAAADSTSDEVQQREVNRPRRATLWSTFIPGAGQIYNGKYWKAGLVYVGAAGLTYMFIGNTDSMQAYQTAYEYRKDLDTNTIDLVYPYLSDGSVKAYRDYHRRLRDISILGFVGLYALQIIDANVDAHLYEFKVNKDLSMRLEPRIRPSVIPQQTAFGLNLSLRF